MPSVIGTRLRPSFEGLSLPPVDSALRQSLLQLSYARLGRFGDSQGNVFELLYFGHFLEAFICDFVAIQVKRQELLEIGQLLEAGVGYLGVSQDTPRELLELDHILETRVGDLGAYQVKLREILELDHVLEARIRDLVAAVQAKLIETRELC